MTVSGLITLLRRACNLKRSIEIVIISESGAELELVDAIYDAGKIKLVGRLKPRFTLGDVFVGGEEKKL
jgi:hypothetical protein